MVNKFIIYTDINAVRSEMCMFVHSCDECPAYMVNLEKKTRCMFTLMQKRIEEKYGCE